MLLNALCVPKTFEQGVSELLKLLLEDLSRPHTFFDDRQEFLCMFHHTVGRHIRNTWGLWRKWHLYRDIHERTGLSHADDMSSLLQGAVWDDYHKLPRAFESDVHGYQAYWEAQDD